MKKVLFTLTLIFFTLPLNADAGILESLADMFKVDDRKVERVAQVFATEAVHATAEMAEDTINGKAVKFSPRPIRFNVGTVIELRGGRGRRNIVDTGVGGEIDLGAIVDFFKK